MRAIDLYAGIGGWSLGLRLAGIDVVQSYEWWQPAIDTHNGNHGGHLEATDIRKLKLEDLPEEIDVVVGSPPCTEFSYSNRGGSGNIAEGLKDLVKFFEIVDFLQPRFWALENVPRVADVIARGLEDPKHVLYRFRHLSPQISVIDFSKFGTPQARRRCIATNMQLNTLEEVAAKTSKRTLGQVTTALSSSDTIVDPVWGVAIARDELTETEAEVPLKGDELRMNREAKTYHAVYNNMSFPEQMDQPSRTVTATCTRVSRESIVIEDPRSKGQYRRLTVRERASLQGFPITYQFYAKSASEKAKLIGNAIPPNFTYLLAQVAMGKTSRTFRTFEDCSSVLSLPEKKATRTKPDGEGRSYPPTRSFRAALPNLRFKSGMRFELSNTTNCDQIDWRVRFFFGSSKDIREILLDGTVSSDLKDNLLRSFLMAHIRPSLIKFASRLEGTTPSRVQEVWTRRAAGLSPYDIVDELGAITGTLIEWMEASDNEAIQQVADYVLLIASDAEEKVIGHTKLKRYASEVFCGLLVGDWFNTLKWHQAKQAAA